MSCATLRTIRRTLLRSGCFPLTTVRSTHSSRVETSRALPSLRQKNPLPKANTSSRLSNVKFDYPGARHTRRCTSQDLGGIRATVTQQERQYHDRAYPSPLRSQFSLLVIAVGVLSLYIGFRLQHPTTTQQPPIDHSPTPDMANDTAPGRPGNLTPEQEEKLRQLWEHVLKLCGTSTEGNSSVETNSATAGGPSSDASSGKVSEKPKKKRVSLFNKKHKDKATDGDSIASTQSPSAITAYVKEADGEDKYGQTQQFLDAIANQTPDALRATIWNMVKHDHPDALLLRFLRARKWDVEKALIMMISTMNWRLTEMHVDDDIIKNGEAGAVEAEKKGEGNAKKLGADFMAQIRMGKSFLHGVDKFGRPVCVVRVRLHKQGEQCEESLERYTVYIIETARMLLSPPIDTATVVFDMTGFSMANMDYTPVKFMIKCFEANYPESLGAVLVHKAPWVFQGIWKIIKGWLDPVVASKVHFTNNAKEMEEFIEPSRIIKELDGPEDWRYKYIEPVDGENDKMNDTAERDRLLEARESLVSEFEEATLQWVNADEKVDKPALKTKRDDLARKLKEDYWRLDPYVRARSFYDRTGVIQPGGKIDFYPKTPPGPPSAKETVPVADTSADDVD